jgi:hypothetical protein
VISENRAKIGEMGRRKTKKGYGNKKKRGIDKREARKGQKREKEARK